MIPSIEAHRHLPGKLSLCSLDADWRSILLRGYVEPAEVDDLRTAPTADHLIVLVRRGQCKIESFEQGRWQQAVYRAGDIGMTAAGQTARLRWRGGEGKKTLQLHIPTMTMRNVVEAMRTETNDPLVMRSQLRGYDLVIATVMTSLEQALTERAPDIYAEAAAHFLTVHLLTRHAGAKPRTEAHGAASRLAKVDDFMRAHLSEQISLADLSLVADQSVFQLIRMCRAQWGETPLARLTRLRMEHARELLRHGAVSIIQVALECGYGNPAHFATAFRRCVGTSPSSYQCNSRSR